MKLRKLKITGFKSFADRTLIDFDHEIIAIVGPNGCGKSNIVDAFRWVMGEQSAKSLRGDKMHDVLFAGSASRKPLNVAEVSVTITDVEEALNTPYNEMEITRRLHRSGESEYLINRQAVRLRDIQGLLLGSGLGKSAFSVFEQGKLDQVINLGPLQRREIFDEAAGTSRFLQRKKETVRKLAYVMENYNRVKDVHIEVEKQTRQLKRQATLAKNFQENQEALSVLEKSVLITKWQNASEKREDAHVNLHELSEKVKEKHSTIHIFEERLEKKKNGLFEKEQAVKREQKKYYQAQSAVQIGANEIKQLSGRLHDTEKRLEFLTQEIRSLDKEHETTLGAIAEKSKRFEALDQEKRSLEQKRETFEDELKNRKQQLKHKQNTHIEALQEEGELRSELQQKQHQSKSISEAILEKKKRRQNLEVQIKTKRAEVQGLTKNIDELQAKLAAVEMELRKTHEAITPLSEQITEACAREKVLKEQFEKVSYGAKALLTASADKKSSLYNKLQALFSYQRKPQTRMYADTLVVKKKSDLEAALTFAKKQKLSDFSLLCLEGQSKKQLEGYFIDCHGASVTEPIHSVPIGQLEKEKTRLQQREKELLSQQRGLREVLRKEEMRLVQENFALQRARADNGEVKERLEDLSQKQAEQVELTVLQKEHTALQNRVDKLQGELRKEERECEHFETQHREAQQTVQEALARWQHLSQEIRIAEAGIAHSIQQKKKLEQEKDTLREALERIELQLLEKKRVYKASEENLALLQDMVHQWDEELEQFREQREEIEKKLSEERDQLGLYEKQRHQLEVVLAEDASVRKNLEAELLERHQVEAEEIAEYTVDLGMGIKEAESKIRELRVAVDRAGAVNMTAIEEYKEYEERHEFLCQQLRDLEASKRDLEEAITKLEKESRKRFKETFEKIRHNFHKNFTILFNGGEADLKFTNSPDILEAGVEIIAKPPGKQMRAISLLSGGEKCLTALALLFALFEERPAPFCILDEVDAPLDDTNVDRFTHVLKQFTDHTQFLVVTHNKRTMAIADLLLGVSMEEKGVSRLISLTFESAALAGV